MCWNTSNIRECSLKDIIQSIYSYRIPVKQQKMRQSCSTNSMSESKTMLSGSKEWSKVYSISRWSCLAKECTALEDIFAFWQYVRRIHFQTSKDSAWDTRETLSDSRDGICKMQLIALAYHNINISYQWRDRDEHWASWFYYNHSDRMINIDLELSRQTQWCSLMGRQKGPLV